MQGHIAEFYEQPALWSKDLCDDPHERTRIAGAISVIPGDVRTVLDLGCGNGAFLNMLLECHPGRFERVIGLDASREALRHVKAEAIQGSVAELPFEDESFDLVTCMETLEHLSQLDFQRAVGELQRVSRKYILLTVPNGEDLTKQLVMCPECRCCFNPYFHVRSLDEIRLRELLAMFRPLKIESIGPRRRERTYSALVHGLRLMAGRCPLPATSICPQCGFQQGVESDHAAMNRTRTLTVFNHALHAVKFLIGVFSPIQDRSTWLLALYERQASRRA
jgi:SAM-dependent methyltransferase